MAAVLAGLMPPVAHPLFANEGDVFRYRLGFMLQDDWQFDNRDFVDIIW
ncbi:MAG: hypothetical protein NTY19_46395 [Planctomycetota bacterium]|nr:hypothetical protein [Planctomycetota bacterium]